ncbi:hypothetical protein MTO96_029964 [Rhipicephalus appendiculatus]
MRQSYNRSSLRSTYIKDRSRQNPLKLAASAASLHVEYSERYRSCKTPRSPVLPRALNELSRPQMPRGTPSPGNGRVAIPPSATRGRCHGSFIGLTRHEFV